MFKSSSTSTNTGLAPICIIEFTDAINDIGDVITSSPLEIPELHNDIIKASVPELTPKQYFEPVNLHTDCSKLCTSGVKIKFPLFSTRLIHFKISCLSS